MTASSGDDVPSPCEPLLAEEQQQQQQQHCRNADGGEEEDSRADAFPLPTASSKRRSLQSNKYALACALLSSVGGLIFGYGTTNTLSS